MAQAHRDTDARVCGAATVVTGQRNVFVNNLLWAVDGDPNRHGDGNLIHSGTTVFVNNTLVIVNSPDGAAPDDLCPPLGGAHCEPATAEGSPNVFAYP